ncbi:MAG: hypothetical protein OXS30_05745 [Chloroflexota bacterium]|nr:hypothetical protein [Chloroflexota bacterium]
MSQHPFARHERLRGWWDSGSGGALVYNELRRIPVSAWSEARARFPEDDGPEPVPPPDRPPARVVDLPEVLALRALLMDRRVAFDTVDRWIRALTQTTRMLDYERPLVWTADQVADRLVQIVSGGEGSTWSTLEVVRELWEWHPDRPFIEAQSERLLLWLEAVLAAREQGTSRP